MTRTNPDDVERRALRLVEDALALPEEERLSFVRSRADGALCARAEALVRSANEAGAFLEVPAVHSLEGLDADGLRDAGGDVSGGAEEFRPGDRLGPYRIVRELGRGGMGRVFLARRDDREYRQEVAIKVADRARSPQDLSRLRRERQILADLRHPNIARLLDGGTTPEGRPYLVMERVEGEPIDSVCARLDLGVRARVELFRKVLAAVAHAHRHRILHLDLKPSNILVESTAGGAAGERPSEAPPGSAALEPRLLDFGVAEMLEETGAATSGARRAMTPEFASPEQLAGGVLSTASDIYSLGRVLREVLGPGARIPEDLRAILARATRADPTRRYPTVDAFDDDLRRYLGRLPVLARGGSPWYVASRFAARHPLRVTFLAAAVSLAVAFVVVTAVQESRVRRERDRAEAARADADEAARFLADLFARFDPGESDPGDLRVVDVLDRGLDALAARRLGDLARARVLTTLGSGYRAWGLYERAEPLLREATDIHRRAAAEDRARAVEHARALNALGWLEYERGRYREAVECHEQALAVLDRASDPGEAGERERASTLLLLAAARQELEGPAAALDLMREGAEAAARLFGPQHEETAKARIAWAEALVRAGMPEDGERRADEGVAILRDIWPDGHPFVSHALNIRARARLARGDQEGALADLERVVDLRRAYFSPDHPRVAEALNNLSVVLCRAGRYESAEKAAREALDMQRRKFGERNDRVAASWHNLALALKGQGRTDEAREGFERSIEIMRSLEGERVEITHPLAEAARLLLGRGDAGQAAGLAAEAVAVARRRLGPEHPWTRELERLEGEAHEAAVATTAAPGGGG